MACFWHFRCGDPHGPTFASSPWYRGRLLDKSISTHGFPVGSHSYATKKSMNLPWTSMVSTWFPMGFPWLSIGFLWVFLCCPLSSFVRSWRRCRNALRCGGSSFFMICISFSCHITISWVCWAENNGSSLEYMYIYIYVWKYMIIIMENDRLKRIIKIIIIFIECFNQKNDRFPHFSRIKHGVCTCNLVILMASGFGMCCLGSLWLSPNRDSSGSSELGIDRNWPKFCGWFWGSCFQFCKEHPSVSMIHFWQSERVRIMCEA